jgi:hypothetical protein
MYVAHTSLLLFKILYVYIDTAPYAFLIQYYTQIGPPNWILPWAHKCHNMNLITPVPQGLSAQ